MKKTILALGLMVALVSCGTSSTEASAPVADSTAVATVDSAVTPVADSACVDTTCVKTTSAVKSTSVAK